jgi:gluconate kinase
MDFPDADDLQPAANREKMRRGVPLTDEDRGPWLKAVRRLIISASPTAAMRFYPVRRSSNAIAIYLL